MTTSVGSSALVALLRSWPLSPARGAPEGDEATAFVRGAVRHGLAGFVAHAVGQVGWELPADSSALLRRESLTGAARSLQVKALLLKSLEALASEGIVPVSLKGYGLALRLYPDPLQRATRDVDLLVSRGEVETAVRSLTGLGLTARPTRDGRHADLDSHHLELEGKAGLVELHFRALAGWGRALEGDALVSRAVEGALEGQRVRWLCPEDEAVYLALHASHHLLQRLAWLFDLKLLAARGLDWDRVVEGARGTGLPQLVFHGWEVARRLLGAPVPEAALEALAPPWWQRRLARRFFTEERLVETELVRSRPRWMAAKLLLAPEPGAMLRYALRRLDTAIRPPSDR
ncbi:nucleotidyltransferase family protein [Myxococcus sp. CA039A]|uniref:nucleotidyltransferase family protein n=1 Tax=Myxococcus sp. CA039A TaxID=2741737 RepID=UPI00157AC235|nr:nucleotidyltransferase family protein [Myxococcus sp. CA039A]NTX55892.1 nucleotidyltransferase family protein [Myxococcus sp. CA039A]